MFSKILIANRGEIALRIIRTCKNLGIQTVAIYSEADAESLFVRQADEAYCVGKSPVNQSYLNTDEIIRVAKESGAEAVHPGYGLLSENAAFARRCVEAGLVFIGPSSDIIASMGSKIEARKMMKEAGVPIVEGIDTALDNIDQAKEAGREIGYPLMLKASAGGGGIGMQLVNSEEELLKAFEGNKKRAESFFGDGTMFIEKYIAEPHHIEVQILADTHGNVIPLWERECSIQRRNQKVVEEAPSPFISEETRKRMLDAAVQAAKHIGYSNAGTIEFLVDSDQNFYFLEMNTRLQVEHPVTEEITGLDLVEQQLKVAYGERLSLTREEVQLKGHAIEVRIYAEDPKTFFPSPGKITEFQLPQGEGIRNECAIEAGSQVTPYYDPMIGKLIAWGETRSEACTRIKEALENYKVEGIKTNIPMLIETVSHEQFLAGYTTTDFVNKYYLPQKAAAK
ncbi:acetyl-CoA carboxylase biotin carboxylase subunit [Psychrobacillus sp. OK032]|uniref:acetyl-CoA carboxylase biotin carboxylase subunit n=1 Tax=Psychrobacillus sp. OK032 TaxID=1884358 RepID=UPI0008D4DA26|nr:acetyl-CoA carboxylase biotin carboxylase subunit [Psychrobacillus sp. OK032]SES42153.1 acetyl-CoA carboxylase, biotin carboxylase subunit [Psychrobacillus sp. OK032]